MVNLGIFSAAMIAFDPFLLDTVHWDLLGAAGDAQAADAHRLLRRRLRRLLPHRARAGAAGRLPAPASGLEPRRRRAVNPRADVDARAARPDDPGRRIRRPAPRAPLDARARPAIEILARAAARPAVGVAAAVAGAARARERLLRRRSRATARASRPGWAWPRAACRARRASRRPPAAQTPLRTWVRVRAAVRARARHRADVRGPGGRGLGREPVRSRARFRFEHRPEWMVAAVMYPHIFEGWSLFSPEAPLSDETVVVDAVTRDGRHVDPYNEVGSRVSSLPVDERAGAPRPRFVLVRLHAAHPRRGASTTRRCSSGSCAITSAPGATRTRSSASTPTSIWQDSPKPGEPPVPTNIRKRRFLHYPENAP